MPASARVAAQRQARHDARMAAAAEVVPHGSYCYEFTGEMRETTLPDGQVARFPATRACPYLKFRTDRGEYRAGYCRLLKRGDATQGRRNTLHLWDGLKECQVNPVSPDEVD